MPKSKRNKLVELSETKKHGLEGKKRLYQKIQSNVDSYTHVLVFSVNDMRNSKMKNVREQWKHSRFCIGKNRVMAKALGRTEEEEYRPNLHKIGQQLKGEKGLLFTNQPVEEVVNWFRSYSDGDYARSGNIATEDVFLSEGPLKQFPHNQEAYLRQLGLPTTLQKGVVHLIKDHVVCHAGERLSPETARILKLLGYEMAEFRIRIESVWSQNGMFIEFNSETKENEGNNLGSFMKEGFELSSDVANLGNEEEMECDLNEVPSNTPKKSEVIKDAGQKVPEKKLTETSPKNKSGDKKDEKIEKNINKEVDTEEIWTVVESDIEEPETKNPKRQTRQTKTSNKGKKSNKPVKKVDENKLSNDVANLGKDEEMECDLNEVPSNTPKKSEVIKDSEQKVQEEKLTETSPKDKSISTSVDSGDKKDEKKEKNVNKEVDTEEIWTVVESDIEEPEAKNPRRQTRQTKTPSKGRKSKKPVQKDDENSVDTVENEKVISIDKSAVLKLTEKKIEAFDEKPKKEEMGTVLESDIEEPEAKNPRRQTRQTKTPSKGRKSKKPVQKDDENSVDTVENEKVISIDKSAVLKLTEKKIEASEEEPKKFSPKLTRSRAAASNIKVKTPDSNVVIEPRSARKRKL